MTIAELDGPVLLRVLPGAAAVLLVVVVILLLPVLAPKALCWLNGPDHVRCAHRRREASALHAAGTHAHSPGHHHAHGPGHAHGPVTAHANAPLSREHEAVYRV